MIYKDDYEDCSPFSDELQSVFEEMEDEVRKAIRPEILKNIEELRAKASDATIRATKAQLRLERISSEAEEQEDLIASMEALLSPERRGHGDITLMRKISIPVWTITSYTLYEKPKCGLCGYGRMIRATGPNGQTRDISCSCAEGRRNAYRLEQGEGVLTGCSAYPLLLLRNRNGEEGYDFVDSWHLNPGKEYARNYRSTAVFLSEELAERFAELHELGERIDYIPEGKDIIFDCRY